MIEHFGSQGKTFYFQILFYDLFYSIIYMLFSVVLLAYILKNTTSNKNKRGLLLLLLILGMFFDWTEDLLIFSMLQSQRPSSFITIIFSNSCALLKFSFLAAALLAAIYLLLKRSKLLKKR